MVLAEELRQAVLQAAIQGKLTERNIADTDIQSTLLEISNERKNLDIDKKLLVAKKIDERDIPFELPATWTWVRLGSICEVITKGSSPKWQGINYTDNGLLFVTSENVGTEKLLLSERKYVDEKFDEISPRSSLKCGDILTNIVGASIGRTAIYNLKEKANINQAVCVIRLIKQNFAPYIMKYMNSNTAYRIMMEDKVETARPNISLTNISDFLVPLPPIEEQQRIVDKINEIMPKINEYEKIEKELEALNKEFPIDMKDALLQAVMQGKLTEQLASDSSVDELLISIQKEKEELIAQKKIKKEKLLPDIEEEEIPFDIPKNWRWVRLKSICTKIIDGDHNPPHGTLEKTEYLMLSAQNINSNKLVDLEQARYLTKDIFEQENLRTQVQMGDILLTIVGTLGRSCIFHGGYHISFQRSVAVISTRIYNRYLKYILDSPYIQQYMVAKATGTAQKGFYLNQVNNLLIPVPSLEEQRRIVERLDALLPLCEDLKEEE